MNPLYDPQGSGFRYQLTRATYLLPSTLPPHIQYVVEQRRFDEFCRDLQAFHDYRNLLLAGVR